MLSPIIAPRVYTNVLSSAVMRIGNYVFALASIAAGILDLIWREFEPAHQPVQAFGDHIPGITILAFLGAACLIAGGLALFTAKFVRFGCIVLGVVYLAFSLCYIPRFFTAPRILGYHLWIFIGLCAGFAMNFILTAAASLIYSSTLTRDSSWPTTLRRVRWVFGISSILFGLVHITRSETVTPMIPPWMPLSPKFWTIFTGVAFILAGVAILARTLDVLAARLLSLMLLVFSVLVLLPMIFTTPHDHVSWGGNAYNLTAVAAVWIFATSVANTSNEIRATRVNAS
jgi:uncharacterized membrane protein